MTGARGWVALAGVVIAIDATARPGETLSEAFDRWLVTHPVLVIGGTVLVVAHLLNVFDVCGAREYDPIHRAASLIARKAEP